jgi:hypothetical protein
MSSKQDLQVKSYFAKMIVRIMDKHSLRHKSQFLELLKTHSTMYSSMKERQIQLMVSTLSGVLLKRGLKQWKKNILTISYMRKGFAIEKFVHLISKAIYCKPFTRLVKLERNLSAKQSQLEGRYRLSLMGGGMDCWMKAFQLAELKKRRNVVFGRTMV